MKIARYERSNSSTIIYLELDNGDLHAHCIMDGILEDRQEVWDLPDDVNPLDLIFTESHHAPEEMPSPFEGDFEANRAKVLDLVNRHKGKVSGDKSAVRAVSQLPAEKSQRLRARLREEFAASRAAANPSQTSSIESSQRVNDELKDIRKGNERRAEELLADDIIAANSELKRSPRADVELTVKFI